MPIYHQRANRQDITEIDFLKKGSILIKRKKGLNWRLMRLYPNGIQNNLLNWAMRNRVTVRHVEGEVRSD